MRPRIAQLRRRLAARQWALPAALLLAVTLPHLNQGDFRGDAGWYSAIGLQAWRTGEFWTLYGEPGQPYFNKPPLVFWIHGLLLHLLGPEVWVARVPSILAALGCVLATVAIVREVAGRRTAVIAGCVLALSLEFFRRIREISLDLWQALFLLLALLVVVRAARLGRWRLIALAGVPVGLALMCKPLVGLVFTPIAALWLAAIGQGRRVPWLLVAGVVALAVAAPWHVSMAAIHGPAFTNQYFGAEIADRAAGRLLAGHDEPTPVWFYLKHLGAGGWPWLLFACFAMIAAARGRLRAPTWAWRLGLVWSACWFVLLTAFADRRDRYAIPLHPGLATMAALWLAHPPWPGASRAVRWSLRWLGPVVVVGGAVIAALPIRVQARPDPQWPALFGWIREQGLDQSPEQVWQGAFSGAHGARVYLEFGWWPRTTRNRWGELVATPPEGSVILYHRRDGWAPGPTETPLASMGDLTVTRLNGPWQPARAHDPGE